ncbi:MAG TPA: penicillin acylase family protein, partial [Longimicrobiales bacterium]|nr:penicillin acylase family protein [Longimicrobiales bacterium]
MTSLFCRRALALTTFAFVLAGCATAPAPPAGPAAVDELHELASAVEIRRTAYGVPHILAPDLRAAAFGLAYVQLEDHGVRIIEGMNAARGRSALVDGARRADDDADAR